MSSNVNSSGYIGQPGTKSLTGTAIAEQIAKLPAAGGVVQLEAGTYYVTAPIVINKSHVSLWGASQQATKLIYDFQGACIQITADFVEIQDLTVVGPDEAKYSEATGIKVLQDNATIRQVLFLANKIGIFTSYRFTIVDDCTMGPNALDGCGSMIVCDIDPTPADSTTIFSNCRSVFCKQPSFIIKQCSQVSLLNCRPGFQSFATTAVPCCLIGQSTGAIGRISIVGLVDYGGGYTSLIKAQPSGTQTFAGLEITSCSATDGGVNSLDIDMGSRSAAVNIHDCMFAGSTGYAIKLSNIAPSSGVEGGAIVRGCRTKPSCANAIQLNATCPRAVITGNCFYGAAATPVDLGSNLCVYAVNVQKGAPQNAGSAVVDGTNIAA